MVVRCEDRPLALTYLDLSDIIDLYYKVKYCICAFPLFIKMDHLPESLVWDFAKTSMIEDNDTVVNPKNIQDTWNFEFLKYHERYLFYNLETSMLVQEFNKHKLNAKRLGGTIRFDGPQCFVLKTSYERQ